MAAEFVKVSANQARNVLPGKKRQARFKKRHLEVRMFNVGDGEAILLVFPGNRVWLVDGGRTNQETPNRKLGEWLADYLKKRKLKLEALVASHPHVDHVGAVAPLLGEKPRLAKKLTLYRSEDRSWHLEKRKWLKPFWAAMKELGSKLEEVALREQRRPVPVADGVEARFFAWSGAGPYTSIFLQLRYGAARLLFTGDAECPYERRLLTAYGEDDFRADVLKVTHHGSSSGTARAAVAAVKPGIAIASTANEAEHRLEADVWERLDNGRRRIWETVVKGDIILRTDGERYGNGVLYQVEFDDPGEFARTVKLKTVDPNQIKRGRSDDEECG